MFDEIKKNISAEEKKKKIKNYIFQPTAEKILITIKFF